MEVSLVFPHQLFEAHPALELGREVHLLEDTLLFGPDAHWALNLPKLDFGFTMKTSVPSR